MPKGAKFGGRQKGTPNGEKRELRYLMNLKFPDYNPVVAMAEIANDLENTIEVRLTAHKEVAKYIEPQLKSSEIKQTGIQELIIRREQSNNNYPPIISSSSGTTADTTEA